MTETPKRLSPKTEVIRRLYLLSGNQCAFPDCKNPIISSDGTYVGEICHIRAAERGGERFDESQTNEERRAFENLLLLCHGHHVATDDVHQYSVEKMDEMKASHEARFERGIADLESSEGIQIANSTITLGGAGGASPGAGGGGGGVIGHGAKAGDGGPGGRFLEIGGLDIEALLGMTPDKPFPGAGGGGAGAVGANVVGGRGGAGGDYVSSYLECAALQRLGISKLNIRVGEGGDLGRDGQPSGYDLVDHFGNVIISVNAPSGGSVSNSSRLSSQSFCAPSFSKTWTYAMAAFLANAVEMHNGLFTVLSGGWTTFICNVFPEEYSWPLVLHISLGGVRPGGLLKIQIVLLPPDGDEIELKSIEIPRDNVSSSPMWIGCVMLKPTIVKTGIWTICIRTVERELSRIPVEIRSNAF